MLEECLRLRLLLEKLRSGESASKYARFIDKKISRVRQP
jgi:ribosome assembly protein YihI (activator of Der GTPase)